MGSKDSSFLWKLEEEGEEFPVQRVEPTLQIHDWKLYKMQS